MQAAGVGAAVVGAGVGAAVVPPLPPQALGAAKKKENVYTVSSPSQLKVPQTLLLFHLS